jgi:hypothetical protein
MPTLSHAEQATERHDRAGDLTSDPIDHQVVDRPEPVARPVVDCRAFDFVGSDEVEGFARLQAALTRVAAIVAFIVFPFVLLISVKCVDDRVV